MSFELELPAVTLDGFASIAAGSALVLVNRDPAPSETGVPLAAAVRLTVLATDVGAVVTLASTVIRVNGVVAFTGGAFQAGFSGSVTISAANRVDYVVQPAAPFLSLSVNTVSVDAASNPPALSFAASAWTFTALDVTTPVVLGAVARSLTIVRVAFDESVQQQGAAFAGDALDPANWSLDLGPTRPEWLPMFFPAISVVRSVSPTAVDVEFVEELSPSAPYLIAAGLVRDLRGNACVPPTNTAAFLSAAPPVPAGRSFDLYAMLPALNRREDIAGTLHLKRFILSLQDVATILLGEMDAFLDALDPDYAPEDFVDAMLVDLGNPFRFDLPLAKKRLLLSVLVQLYKEKGTARGIIAAVLFFLGVTITITDFTSDALPFGEAELGVDWVLGPGGSFALYAFDVHSPISLTEEQRTELIAIVQYMKPAHTHFVRLIEPTAVEIVDHWQLDASELETQSILHG